MPLAGWLFVGLVVSATSRAESDQDLRYRFSVESANRPVPFGTVWLYHYSWYGLERFELARIVQGQARIRLDEARLRADVRPHPNTEAFVVVLELPGPRWHRSPDLEPASLLSQLPASLKALGTSTAGPSGEMLVVVPATSPRRVTLQFEDGRPAAGLAIPVSIFLYNTNHCAHHMGLELGTFHTDAKGGVEVEAPLLPLYLAVPYYERRGHGPAGPTYWLEDGIKTEVARDVVVRKAWDLPKHEYEITLRTPGGAPLPGVSVGQTLRSHLCGALSGSVGQTDASGVARVRIAASVTAALELAHSNQKRRALSGDELAALFSHGRLELALPW